MTFITKKTGRTIRSIIVFLLCITLFLTSSPVISHADPNNSVYKPKLVISNVIVGEGMAGKQVRVTVSLRGECVYSRIRFGVIWDSRLSLVKQNNDFMEPGTAVSDMSVSTLANGSNGFYFEATKKTSSQGNCGKTGTLFSMVFTAPSSARAGDFFPIEIQNNSGTLNAYTIFEDSDGLYPEMAEWLFTTGRNGIINGGIQFEADLTNNFDKQDNKEVLYYQDSLDYNKTRWNQPKSWSSYVDPYTYTGNAKLWFDKLDIPAGSGYAGKTYTVNLNVSGATGKVSSYGFHVYYDTRLTPVADSHGIYFTKKDAVANFIQFSEQKIKDGCINFTASAMSDVLVDGEMASLSFKVPSNAKAGDLYPIGIQFYTDQTTADLFSDSTRSSAGCLLMAHIFTKGIENGYIKISDSGPTSGTTGDCTWNYDDSTKTLTISGNGAMADYGANNTSNVAPWRYMLNDIEVIKINNGVTHIGNYAFDSLIKVPQIIIPDSVKSIGNCAFLWCYALASVKIGSGVETIGPGAFMCGRSTVAPADQPLKEVEIPANVTSIGKRAFGWMYSSSTSSYIKNDELLIKGECGSAAKGYAIDVDNNFAFSSTKHYFTEVVHEQEASCTEIGITRTYCSCGDCTTEFEDALGHDWAEPVYKWTDDHSEVIASCTCKRDPSHVETETVSATLTEDIPMTSEKDGKKVYTSGAFTNPLFTVQTLEIPIERPAPAATAVPSATQTPSDANTVKEGLINDKYGSTYDIKIDANGNPYAILVISLADSAKKLTVPASVKVSGIDVPVTEIASKALRNHKKLVKVTIGKNVRKIGKEAFYGCKNLKTIIFKTTKLKKKTVGKKAFGKIHEKATAKVPKKKLKSYKKILRKRGMSGKKQKIKK